MPGSSLLVDDGRVELVVEGNRAEGLLAILTQSHHTDETHPHHMVNVVRRLRCPCLLIGKTDRMSFIYQ